MCCGAAWLSGDRDHGCHEYGCSYRKLHGRPGSSHGSQCKVDMILMPQDYETAYNGLLQAVQDGTISEERIDESVERIVKVKLQMQ